MYYVLFKEIDSVSRKERFKKYILREINTNLTRFSEKLLCILLKMIIKKSVKFLVRYKNKIETTLELHLKLNNK